MLLRAWYRTSTFGISIYVQFFAFKDQKPLFFLGELFLGAEAPKDDEKLGKQHVYEEKGALSEEGEINIKVGADNNRKREEEKQGEKLGIPIPNCTLNFPVGPVLNSHNGGLWL